MGFTWEHLRELGRQMSVWGCRANAPLEEIREFWTRFLSEELLRVVRGDATLAAGGAATAPGALSREAIQEALARDETAIEQLPGFPHICRQAMEAIDAGKRFPEVAQIIEPDGSLQASLVRAANVARYGSQGRIRALPHALSRLGMEETRKFVMGESIRQLTQRVEQAGFDTMAFFYHSISAGYYAQILALKMDSMAARDREILQSLHLPRHAVRALKEARLWQRLRLHDGFDPFVAGILHDVGKLVNVISYAEAYPLILHQYEEGGWRQELLACEQAVVGDFQHPVAGGALLDRWGVFKRLVDPIRDHHQIRGGSAPGAVLLALANCLAKAVHPFPKRIAIPDAFRRHQLGGAAPSATPGNPLPNAYARLEAPFRKATEGIDLDAAEEGSTPDGGRPAGGPRGGQPERTLRGLHRGPGGPEPRAGRRAGVARAAAPGSAAAAAGPAARGHEARRVPVRCSLTRAAGVQPHPRPHTEKDRP